MAAGIRPGTAESARMEWLEAIRKEAGLPALAAAAQKGDGPPEIAVVGSRRADRDDPVAVDDAFHLGSCTKAMTADLIGLTVDRGKLAWSAPLGELLRALPIHDGWKRVTIENLLTQRSGLRGRSWPEGKDMNYVHRFTGTFPERRERFVRELLAEAPASAPGARFEYSNVNYAVLGHLLERINRTPWERQIALDLWKPLGATGGFGPPPKVWEHERAGDKVVPLAPSLQIDNPPAIAPGGLAHMAIGDWLRFCMSHARRRGPLRPETYDRLHKPVGQYAGGWMVTERSWGRGKVLTHNGSNTLNYAVAWIAPGREFATVAATNIAGEAAEKAADKAVWTLIQRFAPG